MNVGYVKCFATYNVFFSRNQSQRSVHRADCSWRYFMCNCVLVLGSTVKILFKNLHYLSVVNHKLSGWLRSNSVHVSAPDQTAKEGHDYAGQWKSSQKRWTRENPRWESPRTANVRPVFAGSTGRFFLLVLTLKEVNIKSHNCLNTLCKLLFPTSSLWYWPQAITFGFWDICHWDFCCHLYTIKVNETEFAVLKPLKNYIKKTSTAMYPAKNNVSVSQNNLQTSMSVLIGTIRKYFQWKLSTASKSLD